ncbi:helix-turn-helix domain-containing protein (plasmid) [Synechocystis sp. B12]|nr:helix-turn-helix domain-containing protein [Synechocystis sp. B12]
MQEMEKDLLGIFKEKLARYSIRQNDIAAVLGRSPGNVSDILKGRKNPTLTTFMQVLSAAEQICPGFTDEYWRAVAGHQSLGQFVSSLDSAELGILLTLAGQRLIDNQSQQWTNPLMQKALQSTKVRSNTQEQVAV